MDIEKIIADWNKDTKIDSTELGKESLKIPELHNKYYKIFMQERHLLNTMKAKHRQLKLAAYEYYDVGLDREDMEKWGWTDPNPRRFLKGQLESVVESDQLVIDSNLEISMQNEKVEYLEAIIYSLKNRNFIIKNAIEWDKFMSGA